MATLAMTDQAATFADMRDLTFGEAAVAPVVDTGGVELISNGLIVTKCEQLIDL
jgi:hypothetical protein